MEYQIEVPKERKLWAIFVSFLFVVPEINSDETNIDK